MPIVQLRNWTVGSFVVNPFASLSMTPVVVGLTITGGTILVTLVNLVLTEMNAMSVHRTTVDLDPLLAATMTIVAGLRLLGGRLMIKGLQGTTIIDEDALMHLFITMTDAGTMCTDAGTIGVDATIK
jgi:hypothetical protein